ncbi:hypothetical protein ACHWQZ_G005787 [Mnemiopsis leidyi]
MTRSLSDHDPLEDQANMSNVNIELKIISVSDSDPSKETEPDLQPRAGGGLRGSTASTPKKTHRRLNLSGATDLGDSDEFDMKEELTESELPFAKFTSAAQQLQVRPTCSNPHFANKAFRKKMSNPFEKVPKRNKSFPSLNMADAENHFCSKLYHTKRRVLSLKDYHDEARAMRDIGKFLAQPIVLFKVHHTLWEDIVEEMIVRLSKEKPELNLAIKEAMNSVISKDADFVIPECIQGITETAHGPITEQSFIVVIGNTNAVTENQVIMCLLDHPFNFGIGAEEIRFICVILCPTKNKHTKSGIQVARTYATLLSDDRLRHNLLNTRCPDEFAHEFELECTRIHKEHEKREREANMSMRSRQVKPPKRRKWLPGLDMWCDVKRRAKHYFSDFSEDIRDCTSIQKIISTTFFLFFSLLLPAIAFGVLAGTFTDGKIDAKTTIVSQALAGLLWGFFSGQHLVVIRTTIPVVIYTRILYTISLNWGEDGSFFFTFYAMAGLTNGFFLVMYGIAGVSKVMVYCSRSTKEIVDLFVSIAFIVDSVRYVSNEFSIFYCFRPYSTNDTLNTVSLLTGESAGNACFPTKPLLDLLLLLTTVYVGVVIFNFKYSPYLNADKRVMVADYALVVATTVGAVMGSYFFRRIDLGKFSVDEGRPVFGVVSFVTPSICALFVAIGLGFVMSLLFFMTVNISASVINNPSNKLQKGPAYHYDMVLIGIINSVLSLLGLPFVHGSLPHSPLHVRALADIEEHVENGTLSEKIVYVRESRITTIISHCMIGVSILMVPYPLNLIPIPVLYGLFVFLALTSLKDLQLWERLVLIFTEQSLYPPFHYVRKVPQKIIHFFTLLQILQLIGLCIITFGSSVYLKMLFPLFIIFLMPIREKILPTLISERHLQSLDGDH